jgi:hypothetical protein
VFKSGLKTLKCPDPSLVGGFFIKLSKVKPDYYKIEGRKKLFTDESMAENFAVKKSIPINKPPDCLMCSKTNKTYKFKCKKNLIYVIFLVYVTFGFVNSKLNHINYNCSCSKNNTPKYKNFI